MGLWDLLNEEENTKEEVKEAEVVEEKPAVEPKVEKQATEIAEKSKKEEKPAGKKVPKKKASTEKTYKYPFGVYSEGRLIDISSYGFVDGQDYTEKEITDIMLQHRHYEFAGTMEYSYIEDDNVLVVTGKQHRKG